MRRLREILACLVLACGVVFAPVSGHALPSDARQAGVSCFNCHTGAGQGHDVADIAGGTAPGGFVYTVPAGQFKAGLVIHSNPAWSANGSGAGAPTENLLTGARPSSTTDVSGQLTGFSTFLGNNSFTASVGLRGGQATGFKAPIETGGDASIWYRLALTPKFAGLGVTMGLFGATAQSAGAGLLTGNPDGEPISNMVGMDARLHGKLGHVTLDLAAIYLSKPADARRNISDGGAQVGKDPAPGSFHALASVGFDQSFGLNASYQTYNSFDTDTGALTSSEQAATVGAWINISESVVVQPEYTTFGSGDRIINQNGEFRLRLFTGF